MTPDATAREMDRLAHAFRPACEAGLTDVLTVTLSRAKHLSSGMETRQDQRRKGHPYARRHGKVRGADPVLVNFQTGNFLQAWQSEGPSVDGGALSGAVFNTDPKAPWLHGGTRRMLGRPVPEFARLSDGEARRVLEKHLRGLF